MNYLKNGRCYTTTIFRLVFLYRTIVYIEESLDFRMNFFSYHSDRSASWRRRGISFSDIKGFLPAVEITKLN